MNLDVARQAADTVLYEGYLLYPYRASSSKNHARWQFGVLGPLGAAERGLGEEPGMRMQCLLAGRSQGGSSLVVHLRFLQLQRRQLLDLDGIEVPAITVDRTTALSWDEAVEREVSFTFTLEELERGVARPVSIAGGEDVEPLLDHSGVAAGSVVRRRWPLSAELWAHSTGMDGISKLEVRVENVDGSRLEVKDDATRRSLIGSHLIIEAHGVRFVSLLEPPETAAAAAAECDQSRCWPVLAGRPGDTDLLLGLPIILYDYPEIAGESPGALFDATEIDEILTLRVLTMTDAEKAEARATDPLAREIIDRCDEMSPEDLQQLHGALRSPRPPELDTDVPWWDPATDAAVRPDTDTVTIAGVPVARGSLVRVHPNRRADAQDLFFADQVARVTAVLSDVDGSTHVAVVLRDDPAADLHEEAGRFFYFAPDELEPLTDQAQQSLHREENGP